MNFIAPQKTAANRAATVFARDLKMLVGGP
jgi:hypothetical protein